MTTPDLSAEAVQLSAAMENAFTLIGRLASRPRSETFYPGSLAPELMRRSEECLRELTDAVNACRAVGTLPEPNAARAQGQAGEGWRPIAEAPDTPWLKIIGWCVFPAGAEARYCQREYDGRWIALGVTQNVTHFKPWPVDGPPSKPGEA